MQDIFNHKRLVEVLLALLGVVLVMVSVLLVRFWNMLWDRVGLRVVEWVGARGGTRPSWCCVAGVCYVGSVI